MTIELAGPEHIPDIMALERREGFDTLVGCWSADEHAAEMAKSSARYFVLRDGDAITGFAMVQGLGDGHGKAHLRRIAVARPGRGDGTRLMREVLAWLYANSDVNRIDLDVYVGNERAKRSYEKAGFQTEARLRDYHRDADGTFRDMWLMSILRREWEGRGS